MNEMEFGWYALGLVPCLEVQRRSEPVPGRLTMLAEFHTDNETILAEKYKGATPKQRDLIHRYLNLRK